MFPSFAADDDDDDPGLDMEEFRVAMRRAMGPHLSDDEIDAIFMKVTTHILILLTGISNGIFEMSLNLTCRDLSQDKEL